MATKTIKEYECQVCGRKIDVTRSGDIYEEPVFCCGRGTKEIGRLMGNEAHNQKTPKAIRNLTGGLEYRDYVQSKRQIYYIFESKKSYALLTLSINKKNSGNFNIIEKKMVDYVAKLIQKKKGITSKQVVKMSKAPHLIKTSLDALSILYVLVAIGKASIDKRVKGKELSFNSR
jgi:hypothetical protein